MAKPRTGPKFRQPTFKCNICSDSIHRTPRLASTHSQGSCEWFKHHCEVLWVKLGQILQSKAECPNIGHVRDSAIYPICPISTHKSSRSSCSRYQFIHRNSWESSNSDCRAWRAASLSRAVSWLFEFQHCPELGQFSSWYMAVDIWCLTALIFITKYMLRYFYRYLPVIRP